MRIVLQRVSSASVTVNGNITGKIGLGYLVLIGVSADDTKADAQRLAEKVVNLRIFADENDKTNLSLKDVGGGILVISQFTLYADCRKGNRPSFIAAGPPKLAEELYEYFTEICRRHIPIVEQGVFGADMKVGLLNDGPFTVILE